LHANVEELLERHADQIAAPPHDPAGQAQSIIRHDYQETIENFARVRQLYRSPGNGQVADYAIDRSPADELDDGGFRNAEARSDPSFDHNAKNTLGI
jgi:hypothetical protein